MTISSLHNVATSNVLVLTIAWHLLSIGCVDESKIRSGIVGSDGSQIDLNFKGNAVDSLLPFFSDINFTILDSENEDAFFARFDEIVVASNLLVVHEVTYSLDDNILVFSINGDFIRKYLGSSHRGPGSFYTASDILMDEEHNTIEVVDRLTKKVLAIDIDRDTFTELPFDIENVDAFVKREDEYFIYANSDRLSNNIYIINGNGKILKRLFKAEPAYSVVHGKPDIFYYDPHSREVLYKPTLSDTLYAVNENDQISIKVIYSNKSGHGDAYLSGRIKHLYNLHKLGEAGNTLAKMKRDSSYATFGQWRISDHQNLTIFAFRDRVLWAIQSYDGTTCDFLVFDQFKIDDFTKFLLFPRFADSSMIYTVVNSEDLKANYIHLKKNDPIKLQFLRERHPDIFSKYKACISQIDDHSNAVLIEAELDFYRITNRSSE